MTSSKRTKLFIATALLLGATGLAACDTGTSAGTTSTPISGGVPSAQPTGAATIEAPGAVPTGGTGDSMTGSPVATVQPGITPTSSK